MEKKTADDLNTDSKLTAVFAEEFQDRVRYVRESKMWFAWYDKEQRWLRGDETAVGAYVKDFVFGLMDYALKLPREEATDVAEIAIKAQSKFRRDAILHLAPKERSLWSNLDQFDANPELLHCQNGTVDLRTGELREHRREDFITRTTHVNYVPDSTCRRRPAGKSKRSKKSLRRSPGPTRSALLNKVFKHAVPDPEVRAYIGRLAGYSAVGTAREDKLIVLWGEPRSGKGTLVEAISASLGDYATIQKPEFFAKQTSTNRHGHTAGLIPLIGRRMLSVFETEEGLKLDVAFVKTLTGSDPMSVRDMYRGESRAQMYVTPWVMTQHRPEFPHDEVGIMERLLCVPTGPTIPASRRDPKIREALRTDPRQLEATLAWVVRNAGVYLREGLGALPPVIAEANEAYRRAMNPVAEFVSECCITGENETVTGGELRNVYEIWHRTTGFRKWMVPNNKDWSDALTSHGFRKGRTNKAKLWRGVTLKPDTITTGNIPYSKLLDVIAAASPSINGNSGRADRADPAGRFGKLQNKIPYRGYVKPPGTVGTVGTEVKMAAQVVRRPSYARSKPDRLSDRVWKD
jgi:putative DNA primase/helicase